MRLVKIYILSAHPASVPIGRERVVTEHQADSAVAGRVSLWLHLRSAALAALNRQAA